MTHNERICHEAGERRQHYLNQIKCILEKMDDTPCVRDEGGTIGQESHEKPLIEYPGYVNRLNPKFDKPFYEPLIPNVMAERRLYCDEGGNAIERKELPEICRRGLTDEEMKGGLDRRLPPNHALRSKPAELKMGYVIQGCECHKHNGLQDRCERSECGGRPPCLTQPKPMCGPSEAYTEIPPQRPRDELIEEALAKISHIKMQYCCCTEDCGTRNDLVPRDCDNTAKFACYPCSH